MNQQHCSYLANLAAPVRLSPTVIALASVLLCHSSAWAGSAAGEEEQAEQAISPITITATKASGGLPRNLPANSAGYSAKDINEQVNVINTEDIVKYSPDTMTRKRYIGDRNAIIQTRTASVTSSARALVYADGFLLSNLLGNGFAYPARWNMVLPEEIQRVDFFFGPHSAAYPGNSTGTTVLMSTRMPQRFEATGKAQYFSEDFSQYGRSKNFTGSSVSATVGNKAGPLSWLLGFNRLNSTGHPMNYATASAATAPLGVPTNEATGKVETLDPKGARRIIVGETSQEETRQNSFKVKLAYDLSSTLKASYTLGTWQNDALNHTHSLLRDASGNELRSGFFREGGTSYRIGSNAFSENAWQQTHWMNALSLKSHTRGEWDGEAAVTIYRISQDTQHTRQPDGLASPDGTAYGTIIDKPYGDGWATLDLRGTWRPQGSEAARQHEVAFGYHFDEYKLDTHTFYSNATQGNADWQDAPPTGGLVSASRGTTRTQALYAQDAWRFARDWKLTPGLRIEQWQARDGLNAAPASSPSTLPYPSQTRVFRSPKLALQYAVNDDWLLKGAISRAYRMPTVTELYQAVKIGGNEITNNPDLLPERVTSSELTAERGLGDGLLRVSVFTERVRNAIYRANAVLSGGSTRTANTNLDRVHTRGITLAYQQRNALMRGLDLTGSLTYAHARTKHDAENQQARNKVFPGVPDWRATVVGTYHVNDRLNWTLAARYSGRQSNELDNTDIHPDQFGANSRYLVVDTRVTWALDKHYKLAVGIDNLNNEKYYAFHPMPNRTVHLELRAQH